MTQYQTVRIKNEEIVALKLRVDNLLEENNRLKQKQASESLSEQDKKTMESVMQENKRLMELTKDMRDMMGQISRMGTAPIPMDMVDGAAAASPALTTEDGLEALKRENSELKTRSTLLQTEHKAALEDLQKENARLRELNQELGSKLDSVSGPSEAEKSIPFLHCAIQRLQAELASARSVIVEYQRQCEALNGPFGELPTLKETVGTMEKVSATAKERAEVAERKLKSVQRELEDVKGESEARRIQMEQLKSTADENGALRTRLRDADETIARQNIRYSELVQHSLATGPFDVDNTVLILPSWILHGVARPEGEVHYELYSPIPRFHHYFLSPQSIAAVRDRRPDLVNGALPLVGQVVNIDQQPPAADGNPYGLAAGTIFFICLVTVRV